jgi:hypothetical protein
MLEPGETWREPLGESSQFVPYGLIRQVQQGKTDEGFSITFRYGDSSDALARSGVRTHMLASPATEVYLGKSPRVRQAEGDDQKAYDYWMPQLVVRRRGSAPLESLFAAVHEPFREKPFLDQVRAAAIETGGRVAAIEIIRGDLKDTIISTGDTPPYPERRVNRIALRGRLGIVRQRADRVLAAWLIDGVGLSCGDVNLNCPTGRYEGAITSVTRKSDGGTEDALITQAELPEGGALAGRWMIVTHGNGHTHAYRIAHVQRRDGKSIVVCREDHGLRIQADQTEECYFPRRKIAGPNRFVIPLSAVWPEAD